MRRKVLVLTTQGERHQKKHLNTNGVLVLYVYLKKVLNSVNFAEWMEREKKV